MRFWGCTEWPRAATALWSTSISSCRTSTSSSTKGSMRRRSNRVILTIWRIRLIHFWKRDQRKGKSKSKGKKADKAKESWTLKWRRRPQSCTTRRACPNSSRSTCRSLGWSASSEECLRIMYSNSRGKRKTTRMSLMRATCHSLSGSWSTLTSQECSGFRFQRESTFSGLQIRRLAPVSLSSTWRTSAMWKVFLSPLIPTLHLWEFSRSISSAQPSKESSRLRRRTRSSRSRTSSKFTGRRSL